MRSASSLENFIRSSVDAVTSRSKAPDSPVTAILRKNGESATRVLQGEPIEQSARARAVRRDLGFERINRFERPLVAQPLHEADADRGPVEVAVEIEDVGFDRPAPICGD